jgi:hypothetical protein
MPKRIEMTGQRFGSLVVIGESDQSNGGRLLWDCVCDCGGTRAVAGSSLRSGRTKTCGCRNSPVKVGARFGRLVALGLGATRIDRGQAPASSGGGVVPVTR